jgi:hypothetical protein
VRISLKSVCLVGALLPVVAFAQDQSQWKDQSIINAPGITTLSAPPSLAWVTFGSGVAVNTQTGEVRIPKNLALDKAAREFWNMVATVATRPAPFPGVP